MISYEIIGIALTVIGSIIKFSLDYARLKAKMQEQNGRICELENNKETIFNRIEALKEHNSKGINDLEKTLVRVETKLDLIMTRFEMNITE